MIADDEELLAAIPVGGGIGHRWALPVPLSSWIVVDGFVWPLGEEPRLPAGHGPSIDRRRDALSAARQVIRDRIAAKARR